MHQIGCRPEINRSTKSTAAAGSSRVPRRSSSSRHARRLPLAAGSHARRLPLGARIPQQRPPEQKNGGKVHRRPRSRPKAVAPVAWHPHSRSNSSTVGIISGPFTSQKTGRSHRAKVAATAASSIQFKKEETITEAAGI